MPQQLKPQMVSRCMGCESDVYDHREYSYMVHDEEWAMLDITKPPMKGLLCIGCFQKWRGRKLCAFDFNWTVVLNHEDISLTGAFGRKTHQKSHRLLETMLRLDGNEKINVETISFEEVELRVLTAMIQQARDEHSEKTTPLSWCLPDGRKPSFYEVFQHNRALLDERAQKCGMIRKHG